MRHITSCFVVLFLGLALVQAAPKKLEKKSIADSLAPKAIEQVDQKLDAPAKLSDEALLEAADGQNVDRAKKQASTTFCVEIRQNKPTQGDYDELSNRPGPQQPSLLPTQDQDQHPIPIPQQQPEQLPQPPQVNIEIQPSHAAGLPCEPEIGAYIVPGGDVVYAPTGNCAQHIPTLLHVPTVYGPRPLIPAGAGGPSIQVLHLPGGGLPTGLVPLTGYPTGLLPSGVLPSGLLPSGVLPSGLLPSGVLPSGSLPSGVLPSGLLPSGVLPSGSLPSGVLPSGLLPSGVLPAGGTGPTIHITPGTGAPSGPSIHPLHTHGGQGGLPSLHPHGIHHLNGVECTCKSTSPLGRDAGTPSNEQLAVQFLHDIQKNAQQPGSPMVSIPVQGLHSSPANGDRWTVGTPKWNIASSSGSPSSPANGDRWTVGDPKWNIASSSGSPSSPANGDRWTVGAPKWNMASSSGSPSSPANGDRWHVASPLPNGSPASGSPASGQQWTLSLSAPGENAGQPSAGKSAVPVARYMPLVRPMSNVQSQVMYQQQASAMGSGMHGMPMNGYGMSPMSPMVPMMTPGGGMPMMRSKADCLEDSFQNGFPVMQGLRLSRGPDEAESKAAENEEGPKPENQEEAAKKSQEEAKEEATKARLARFLMSEKDTKSNSVDD